MYGFPLFFDFNGANVAERKTEEAEKNKTERGEMRQNECLLVKQGRTGGAEHITEDRKERAKSKTEQRSAE